MTVLELPKYSDLLALPFEEDGNGPLSWNCWNLCREIYKRAGLFLPQYSDWIESITQRDSLIKEMKGRDFQQIVKPEPLALVGVKLSREEPECITQVGVMLNKRWFLNVRRRVGVALEDSCKRIWEGKIEGYYRYGK